MSHKKRKEMAKAKPEEIETTPVKAIVTNGHVTTSIQVVQFSKRRYYLNDPPCPDCANNGRTGVGRVVSTQATGDVRTQYVKCTQCPKTWKNIIPGVIPPNSKADAVDVIYNEIHGLSTRKK